jgi:hypothetical protein
MEYFMRCLTHESQVPISSGWIHHNSEKENYPLYK